jgi:P2-related tail formation protein
MSLLPTNETLKNQRFADLLDRKSIVDYSDIEINPLTCNASLLPHIALIKGANINGMLENEARQYLNINDTKKTGTIGAVEDAVNVVFEDAKVIEWFEDKNNLIKGMFRVDVNIKSDKNVIYDERLFSLSTRLIQNSKNVRSKLKKISLKLPNANTNINEFTGGVFGVNLQSVLQMNSKTNITLKGGVAWMV